MPTTLKVQNFYYTNVTSESIPSSGDFTVNVGTPPSYQNGFLVIATENILQREIVYFHAVSGNTISVRAENRGLGGTTAKEHIQGESVTMKDVAEIFNFYSDTISTCFFVEKTGGLNVKVWGGSVYYNTVLTAVADTTLTLTNNAINYIKYDYTTNIISADTVNVGNIKAIVTVSSGVILSIVYQTAKETYTDFTVSLNTALPSQPGNGGKFLHTDGANATWQPTNIPTASATAEGVVEIATLAESAAGTNVGATGAPLSSLPGDLKLIYQPIGDYTVVKNGTYSTLSASSAAGVTNTSSGALLSIATIGVLKLDIYSTGAGDSSAFLEKSPDNATWSTVYQLVGQNTTLNQTHTFMLLGGYYYRCKTIGAGFFSSTASALLTYTI